MTVRNQRDQNATGYRTLIQESMKKTIRTGSMYEAARHGVPDAPNPEQAGVGHHIAVMELFSVLRPYLSSVPEVRADYWEGTVIGAEKPYGLKNLAGWRTKAAKTSRPDTSPFSSRGAKKRGSVARPLDPNDAFHAADALLAAAHELGFAPEPDLGLPHTETTLEDLKGRSPLSTIALEDPEQLEQIRAGRKTLEIETEEGDE